MGRLDYLEIQHSSHLFLDGFFHFQRLATRFVADRLLGANLNLVLVMVDFAQGHVVFGEYFAEVVEHAFVDVALVVVEAVVFQIQAPNRRNCLAIFPASLRPCQQELCPRGVGRLTTPAVQKSRMDSPGFGSSNGASTPFGAAASSSGGSNGAPSGTTTTGDSERSSSSTLLTPCPFNTDKGKVPARCLLRLIFFLLTFTVADESWCGVSGSSRRRPQVSLMTGYGLYATMVLFEFILISVCDRLVIGIVR